MKKPANDKRRGKGHLKRPQFQEMVALQGMWTIHSMIAPTSTVLLWLCVPVALFVAEVARRAHARRVPTLLSQAAIYVQLMLAEFGLNQAHWAAGDSSTLASKAVIMTVLVAIMVVLEIAARPGKGPRLTESKRPAVRLRPTLRPSRASHVPRRNRMPRRGRKTISPRRRRRVANPGPPRRTTRNTRPHPRIAPASGLTRRAPTKRAKPNKH